MVPTVLVALVPLCALNNKISLAAHLFRQSFSTQVTLGSDSYTMELHSLVWRLLEFDFRRFTVQNNQQANTTVCFLVAVVVKVIKQRSRRGRNIKKRQKYILGRKRVVARRHIEFISWFDILIWTTHVANDSSWYRILCQIWQGYHGCPSFI